MKIAMIGHKRIPSREGGIEIVVEELAVRMAQDGHKVDVYNRNGHHVSGKSYDNMEEKKIKEYKSGKKGLIGLFVGEVKKLSKGKADMNLVNKLLAKKLN